MNRVIGASLTAIALLSACSRQQPDGQVLAAVDGEDITMRDLAAEGAGDPARGRQMLDTLIDRRLLAEAARERGLDRNPDYLAGMRRAREQLLVQMLARDFDKAIGEATPAEIARYISDNPQAFGARRLIELAAPGGNGDGITLDSAQMRKEEAAKLAALRPGEAYATDGVSRTVIAIRPAPLSGAEAETFARQSIKANRVMAALQAELARRRTNATILYKNSLGQSDR